LFLEFLADFEWTGGGANDNWQTGANWASPTDPTLPGIVTQTAFPNDPGRDDMDEVAIVPVVGANFSVPLAGDLTVDINGSDVTVASVQLGGTAGAVTTDIASTTGHKLIFENFELNDTMTNPGNAGADPPVLPEPIWSFNQSNPLIWSTGTSGAGKMNQISADIEPHSGIFNSTSGEIEGAGGLHVEGDRDLHVFGKVIEHVPTVDMDDMIVGDAFSGSLTSLLTGGATLFLHGDVVTSNVLREVGAGGTGSSDVVFQLNSDSGVLLPFDPQRPRDNPPSRTGLIDMSGRLVGNGNIDLGNAGSTIILRGDSITRLETDPDGPMPTEEDDMPNQSIFTSRVFPAGTMVLAHDGALGGGNIKTDGGTVVISSVNSTDDARNIPTDIQLSGNITVRGASTLAGVVPGLPDYEDHSIEFSGELIQTNTRSWVNELDYDYDADTGPTLTISGPQYPVQGGDSQDSDRILTITGPGKTIVTGGIHNEGPDAQFSGRFGHFRKRGSGTVVIDFDLANAGGMEPDSATDYRGDTYVESGNLRFATNEDLPNPVAVSGRELGVILSRGGAVGVDDGVIGNDQFLDMLHNSSTPNFPGTTSSLPFFKSFAFDGSAIFNRWSHGGLMLAQDEYDDDLDFSGDLANGIGRAANMTLAARETNSTYTGTITPSSTVTRYADTYLLGGGSGTLTLPNEDQLTGARDLRVDNGGEVRLESANDYSGKTEVRGNTTLTVTNLTDGDSSIGSPTDADDLVIQNGTLQYVGGAATTNRLFTLGTAGGTLESSGSGPINFSNTGPLAIDIAEDREAIATNSAPGNANNELFGLPALNGHDGSVLFDTSDLVTGMAVNVAASEETGADPFNLDGSSGPGVGDDLIITSVPEPDVILIGEEDIDEGEEPGPEDDEIPWAGFSGTHAHLRYDFGPAPRREFTLSGENTGDNTFAPQITDASDIGELDVHGEPLGGAGGKGSVRVAKSGSGKWILANDNNTYTGDTVVEEGTLVAVSIGDGDLTVEDGGTIAPGMSVGTLTVGGLYRQHPEGTYQVEIEGTGAGQYDVLEIIGDPEEPEPEEGDYNEDGVVNAADYAVWRNHLGETFTLPNEDEDAETPGVVDEEDYNFWRDNFGNRNVGQDASAVVEGSIFIDLLGFNPTAGDMFEILTANSLIANNLTLTGESAGFELLVNPTSLVLSFTGAGSGSGVGTVVPEPSSLLLASFAMIGMLARMRRRS
jgi:autotransporter-associated beta strand protein